MVYKPCPNLRGQDSVVQKKINQVIPPAKIFNYLPRFDFRKRKKIRKNSYRVFPANGSSRAPVHVVFSSSWYRNLQININTTDYLQGRENSDKERTERESKRERDERMKKSLPRNRSITMSDESQLYVKKATLPRFYG